MVTLERARETLIQGRLAKLEEIKKQRTEQLMELYRMIQVRDNMGKDMKLEGEDTRGMDQFLDRFDLDRDSESGSILTFTIPEIRMSSSRSPSLPHHPHHSVIDNNGRAAPRFLRSLETSEDNKPHKIEGRDQGEGVESPISDPPVTPPEIIERRDKSGMDAEEVDMDLDQEDSQPHPAHQPKKQHDAYEDQRIVKDDEDEREQSLRRRLAEEPGSSDRIPIPIDDVDELDIISVASPTPPDMLSSRGSRSSQLRNPASSDDNGYIEETSPADQEERRPQGGSVDNIQKGGDIEMEDMKEEETESQMQLQSPSQSPSLAPSSPPRTPPQLPKSEPTSPGASSLFSKPSAPPLLIDMAPSPQRQNGVHFNFVGDYLPVSPVRPVPPVSARFKRATQYTLPPLSALPVEFNRKSKPSKSKKREKEREKSSSDNGKKDDWVPLGMARWAAMLRTNPVYKKVGRATKCLSTRDWNTAMMELKLIRTFDRIEVLKDGGRWSFRQPKKQRGVGGLTKTHWDYLLDEMKWLQTDYREERKWKLAVAFELASDVLEWHEAGSTEERLKRGICALWKKPAEDDYDMEMDMDLSTDNAMEAVQSQPPDSEEEMHSTEHILDGLQDAVSDQNIQEDESQRINQTIQEAFEDAEPLDQSHELQTEHSHGPPSADVDSSQSVTVSMNESTRTVEETGQSQQVVEGPSASQSKEMDGSKPFVGLKEGSKDPTLDTLPESHDSKEWSDRMNAIRESIASLPNQALWIDLHNFEPLKNTSTVSSIPDGSKEMSIENDLTNIFSDLQLYTLPEVTLLDSANGDSKKKADKKDRDGHSKRLEETTYSKLYPTSVFMHTKPTLISALQPSKKWRKGTWKDLDESPVLSDADTPPTLPMEELSSSLFEGRKPNAAPFGIGFFIPPSMRESKRHELSWTAQEDILLKESSERYPNNWRLISDTFNSSRITLPSDKRSPLECQDRWRTRWGPANRQLVSTPMDLSGSPSIRIQTPPLLAPGVPQGQMTTRGIKRSAAAALSINNANASASSGATTVDRKRRRHNIMSEAMRKAVKKREAFMKANLNYRKLPGIVHETHLQYGTKTKSTPQELSRMKAEKDAREAQEFAMAQRRQEEIRRQQVREHAARMQMQNQQLKIQQAEQARAPQSNGLAIQNMPQIRSSPQVNISQHQQQRIPTPMISGAPLSPQAMLQQAQVRAMTQAQAQAQMQGQLTNMVNGAPHMSPQFSSTTGMPIASPGLQQASPPRSSATPINGATGSPRPPSAQRNPVMPVATSMQVAIPGNPIARQSNMAAYFPNIGGGQYTQEQVAHFIRLQLTQSARADIVDTMGIQQQVQQGQLSANQQASFPPQANI